MPPANRDASELTRKRRAMALYAFNNAVVAAQSNGVNTVRREQNNTQTLDVATARKQGGCYCAEAAAGTYRMSGTCGC